MTSRMLFALGFCVFLASGAGAATIDPELETAFGDAGDGATLQVMLLPAQPADYAALARQFEHLPAAQRQGAVAGALRQHAVRTQAKARGVLDAVSGSAKAASARTLWTIGALAFEATYDQVRTLAASAEGHLVHDRPYDMISAVTRAGAEGPADVAKVPVLAWSVDWVNADEVWNGPGYTGNGIIVAHVDSGADMDHPDLVNGFWTNGDEIAGNGIDDDANGYVDDVHGFDFYVRDGNPEDDAPAPSGGHGTHTAGSVVGDGTAGTQTGVAPGASLMVCKVFPSGTGGAPFSAIYEAHQYAVDNGARLITQSLGVAGLLPDWLMRVERNNGDALRAAGLVLVAAAGNDHFTYTPPNEVSVAARVPAPWMSASVPYSSLGGVIAVGGTGYQSNSIYTSSARGPVDWSNVLPWNDHPSLIKPDIAAPGKSVNSTTRGGGYSGDTWDGTSMSTPHVAGAIALMLEKNPSLTPEQISEVLETSALDLGTAGKDNNFGAGLLDALAAVDAVPATNWPHVVTAAIVIADAGGDGIIDPGEDFDLLVELVNNSFTVDATGISATLEVLSDPLITVIDGNAVYPDLPLGGASATNDGDVFTLHADGAAEQGRVFAVNVTITADGGFSRSIDNKLAVGLPEHADHDVGNVVLTITDQGTLGYLDDTGAVGSGFHSAGGSTTLFIGSFWGGTGIDYICNRDYTGGSSGPAEVFEWQTVESPNGRVKNLGPLRSDQDYRAIFNDSGHASPRKLQITQNSYAWADEGYNEFVILSYTVHNNSQVEVADWYGGIFCDWDVADSGANLGGSNAGRKVSYVNATGGPYVGVASLTADPVGNLTLINNPTYVYDNASIEDGIKARHLRGVFSLPSTTTADDWSALTSVGPLNIPAGGEVKLVFAMVWGQNLAGLLANVDAANERWVSSGALPVENPGPGEVPSPVDALLGLRQNVPNPFNPTTRIAFAVDHAGPVRLRVYDLAGRHVKTLADAHYEVGDWAVVWDGTDDRGVSMPSGMYLYRLEASGKVLSRKMMLVK